MKATAQTFPAAVPLEKSTFAVWSELFKARLTGLVVVTSLAGFYMGASGGIEWRVLFHALMGIGLVACGAAALNQWWERDYDALMPRTQNRPLPSGAITTETALAAGVAASVLGLAQLALLVNLLTALLAALTLGIYLLIYTPLKRVTIWNTLIGAVPGALPPLMGWTAVRGEVTREGLALFAIQFFWQMPHFLAIAWLYRDQYERGGYMMLPVVDRAGTRTGRESVSHALALVLVSLCPVWFGLAGSVYLIGALLAGAGFVATAVIFSQTLTRERARQMFFASLIYLPAVLGLMAADKLGR